MASALNRPLVLAYNHIACSGDDAAFQVGQYRFRRAEDGKVDLSFEVLIVGSSATDLQTKEAAFDAIRGEDGALVVQLGPELEIDALVADGTTTVTSAGGGFLTAHEGLWLSIRGHTPRRIVTRNSATSVTLNASVTTGSYRAFLAAKHFAGTHAAYTFIGGRCSTEKLQNRPENTEFSRLMSVSVTGNAPAKASLRSLNVSIAWDPSRRRTATLRGSFAPYDYDGDGDQDSAKAVHDYYIGTLVTNHLSAFGGATAYELSSETQSYDAPEDIANFASSAIPAKNYSFTRVYVERFVADAVGVILQQCPVTVTQNTTHGLPALAGQVTGQCRYQAHIDHDVVTETGLRAYYVATIRPLIIAAIKLHAGTSRVVVVSEVPTIDQTLNTIGASWDLYFPSLSSKILKYSKTISRSMNDGRTLTDLWDGDDFTFEESPTGGEMSRTIVVQVSSQVPVTFTASGELDLGDAGGAIGGVVVHGGGGDGGVLESKDFAGFAGGKKVGGGGGTPAWKQNGGEEDSLDVQHLGKTLYGGGTDLATIYNATATRRYVWAKPAAPVVPAFKGIDAPAPVITGAGAAG